MLRPSLVLRASWGCASRAPAFLSSCRADAAGEHGLSSLGAPLLHPSLWELPFRAQRPSASPDAPRRCGQ